MELTTAVKKDVVVVSIVGNVLQEDVNHLRQTLDELLKTNRFNIVLDLSATQYVSSMGLAAIVSARKQFRNFKGDVRLAGANELVYRLLETTRLLQTFSVHHYIEDAVESYHDDTNMEV